MAEQLGRPGFFTWHGNYYALNLTETLGLEPDGMLRVGLVHYNTLARSRAVPGSAARTAVDTSNDLSHRSATH